MQETPATRHSLIVKLRDPADHVAWHEFVAIYKPLVYQLAARGFKTLMREMCVRKCCG
jgi:hypothetical protein